MIKFENVSVAGFEAAIRGMRNPKNSWAKSDSHVGLSGDEWSIDPGYIIGEHDKDLMMKLSKGGPVHAKYRRQIVVWVDITAPTYWWAEFDTYRYGRERNSCSFMHKGTSKPFEIVDFSFDIGEIRKTFVDNCYDGAVAAEYSFHLRTTWEKVIEELNELRDLYLKTKDDRIFQMIRRLLPSGYNIRATIMMSYEVLANTYHWRKNHRLDEWREFCKWAETLPYSWIFTGIEMLESEQAPVTDDLPDSNQYFVINLGYEEIRKAVFDGAGTEWNRRMDLYLDGVWIGTLHSIERDDYALWRYKLCFVINLITGPENDPKFAERVCNIQKLWNSGELNRSITYNNATGGFDLNLSTGEENAE